VMVVDTHHIEGQRDRKYHSNADYCVAAPGPSALLPASPVVTNR
jgi:hypothetical protein